MLEELLDFPLVVLVTVMTLMVAVGALYVFWVIVNAVLGLPSAILARLRR